MKTFRLVLSLSLLLPLAGCGFHLRNALVLPPDLGPVAVTAQDPYSPLAASLARSLERAGAVAATSDTMAGAAKLEILSEKWVDIPIAVDNLGRAQEYSLRYAVTFRLRKDVEGTVGDGDATDRGLLVPLQAVELTRDYIAPPTDSIGRNSERELLTDEMRRDMGASILRRIEAALRATETTKPRP